MPGGGSEERRCPAREILRKLSSEFYMYNPYQYPASFRFQLLFLSRYTQGAYSAAPKSAQPNLIQITRLRDKVASCASGLAALAAKWYKR